MGRGLGTGLGGAGRTTWVGGGGDLYPYGFSGVAFAHSSVHSNFLHFSCNDVIGYEMPEKFSMNLL